MPAPTPEMVALARRLYTDGARVADILAETKLNTATMYQCLDGGFGPERLEPIPRRHNALAMRKRPMRVSRASLISRLWTTAERQVRDIETRLIQNSQEPTERERDARVLSVLVKTLRELAAFDAEHGETTDMADDDFPRDVDELRRELSRRLDSMAAGAS